MWITYPGLFTLKEVMIRVHSLSGGKTSSYMAVHYPADYNVFSLVMINDRESAKLLDKGIRGQVESRIGREFTGTAEDDITLKTVLDLEQFMGREIIWQTAIETFDELIDRKKMLPNQRARFCTQELKLKVIFDWWFKNIGEVVSMGMGYRFDEAHRKDKFTTSYKYWSGNDCFSGSKRRKKWKDIVWRFGWFPLIDDKVFEYDVKEYWKGKPVIFPPDSNCIGCFWKNPQQLLINSKNNPLKFDWFCRQETKIGASFKKDITYREITKIDKDENFIEGAGPGCQAGFCTD